MTLYSAAHSRDWQDAMLNTLLAERGERRAESGEQKNSPPLSPLPSPLSTLFIGAFRRFGDELKYPGSAGWYFPGNFWWMRCSLLSPLRSPHSPLTSLLSAIPQTYHGVEAWPAMVASADQSIALRADRVGNLNDPAEWQRAESGEGRAESQKQPFTLPSPPSPKWEGGLSRKPWHYQVTAAIPVLDTPEEISLIVDLLRLQTMPPYTMLIDTGSTPENLVRIQSLAAEDVEVHSLRFNGVRHPSDFPAVAMDLATSACRTPFLFCTHSDCFPRSRSLIERLAILCGDHKAVGYELSPREHPDWKGMLGHTCTMFNVALLDDINAYWSLRRLCRQYHVPHEINARGPNWPDTELLLNYQLRAAGITPLLIGGEQNRQRTLDQNIDHCRSFTASNMTGCSHHATAAAWIADAKLQARQRIQRWTAAESGERRARSRHPPSPSPHSAHREERARC